MRRQIIWIALFVIFLITGLHRDAFAFTEARVWVRIDSVNMITGPFRCFDQQFLNCNRPDFFVTLETDTLGQAPMTTPVVMNFENVGPPAPPGWTLASFNVRRPAKLTLAVFDADGPETDQNGNGTNQDELMSVAQPADLLPGLGRSVTIDLEPLMNGPDTTLSFVGEDVRMTVTLGVEMLQGKFTSLSAPMAFRPSSGERITFQAMASGGPRLDFVAYGPNGIAWSQSVQVPLSPLSQNESVSMEWTGLDAAGNVLPPGSYLIEVSGINPSIPIGSVPTPRDKTTPETRTVNVTIQPPLANPTLTLRAFDPGPQWAPETGPMQLQVVSNSAITVNTDFFVGSSCGSGAPPLVSLPPTVLTPLTDATIKWDGTTPSGAPVAPGAYAVRISGRIGLTATTPREICRQFSVVAAPPPLVVVRHTPFLAQPGDVVTLTALSVDASGLPRRVPALAVFGETAVLGNTPTPAPAPLTVCQNTTTCSATITMPTEDAMFAWRGESHTAGGVAIASSGWRGQRITAWSSLGSGISAFAIAVDQALPGPLTQFSATDFSRGFDIVFNVSTNFSWTNSGDLSTIGNGLATFMDRLFGLVGNGSPAGTTFLSRQDLVRVYVVPEQTAVSWTTPKNLCEWSVPSVSWADARGVLHRSACRDNAYSYWRSFSSKLNNSDVIAHELHHALFGLADEYEPDGGYWPSAELPNVFRSLSECAAVPERPANGCGTITEAGTGWTFFRLDEAQANDIMQQGNGAQRFGDIRQARHREGRCALGDC